MKKDKAIKQALQRRIDDDFPYLLKSRILTNVHNEVEKRMKRAYIRNIILVSFVSALLVAGTIYLLVSYFGFSFSMPDIYLSPESKTMFISCTYIASIILLLLIFDTLLRKLYNKRKNSKSL